MLPWRYMLVCVVRQFRTDDPNNYRAVTLTSVILNLFETAIVERSKHTILANLSPQQGARIEQIRYVYV